VRSVAVITGAGTVVEPRRIHRQRKEHD